MKGKNDYFKRVMALLLAGLITTSTVAPSLVTYAQDTATTQNSTSVVDLVLEDYIIKDNKIAGLSDTGKAKVQANPNINIKSINGITEIDANAFNGIALNSVVIGSGITKIGGHAFQMTKIKKLTLKSGITEIGEYAFADNELATIDIQAQLDTVGNYSFYSNNLTAVTIDAKNIGRNAFSANKLTEVTLKNTVNVGEEAFVDNPDLKKIVVDTQNPPKDIFKENTFQENASPIEVTIRNNANGVVSLDKNKYLINIITVKISTI